MSNSKLMGRLLQSTILVGAVAAAAPAMAQDDVDTITVTGTLIRRADIDAPSPVSSVDAAELAVVNTVNTEEFLNTLPQAVPGLDGSSNNPGDGVATANLRGLGATRTLVLVEGRRFVPYDVGGVVDLNNIPAALVERVDVVTGGASALYGSDAMAGVVNFLLKDDFQGLQLDTTYAGTEREDGQIFQASVIAGGNFDDGRGNATFFAAYTDRQSVFQGDRDFSAVANNDALEGSDFSPFGSSGVPGSRLFDTFNYTAAGRAPTPTSLDFDCGIAGISVADPDGSGRTTDANGDPQTPTFSGDEFCGGGATFDANGNVEPFVNRYNYAPVNYLQLPQERYNLAGFANYDITDNIRLNLRGMYSQNVVAQELAPTPFFETVVVDPDTSAVSDDFLELLNATDAAAIARGDDSIFNDDGTYTVDIGRRLIEVGPRNSNRDQSSTQWSADLQGEFDNGMQWTTYAQFARSVGSQRQSGNASVSAGQAAFRDGTCNFFQIGGISEECVTAIERTGIINTAYEQTIIGAQLSGDLLGITIPSATNAIAFAAGVEYREEFGDFAPDSVLGPDVSGFNQALPISGRFDVADVFAEVVVPLVEGAPGIEELSFNGAYRHSDYSTIGSTDTYSLGGAYSPAPGYTLKASYNRAVRAPNIADLFAPLTNGFPGAFDPCAADEDGNAQGGVQSICVAEGVPEGAFNTNAIQPNTQTEALFGGSTELGAETADTFTIGVVAQPDFADGLTVKVDYYDIEIEDVISSFPIQTVLNGCYIRGDADLCDLVTRNPGGSIDNVVLTADNLALRTAEGIDVDIDYSLDAADMGLGELGTFGLRFVGTYQIEAGFQALPDGQEGAFFYDTAGFFGGRGGLVLGDDPRPEWKHTAFLDWGIGDLTTTLRWRYISSVDADDELLNENVGLDGQPFTDDDLTNVGNFRGSSIDAFSFFDLTGQYQLNETLRFTVGVNNLFDEEPPIQGDSFQEQANTFPATYDALGRRYFVGVNASF